MSIGEEGAGISIGIGTKNPAATVHIVGEIQLKAGPKINDVVVSLDGLPTPGNALPTAQAVSSGAAKLMVFASMGNSSGSIKTLTESPEINEKVLNYSKIHYSLQKPGAPVVFNGTHFRAPSNGLYRFEFDFLIRNYNIPTGTVYLTVNTTSSARINLRAEELLALSGVKPSKTYMGLGKTIYLKAQEHAKIQVSITSDQDLIFEDSFAPNRLTITRLIETTIENYVIN